MLSRAVRLIACVTILGAVAERPHGSAVCADDGATGGLAGKILFDGDAPRLSPLVKAGSAPVCGPDAIPSERLVVDAKTKGIRDVLVWMRSKPDGYKPTKPKAAEVRVDQEGCRFHPHVLVVRTDQTVRVSSSDACVHNIRGNPLRNTGFNFILQAQDDTGRVLSFRQPEAIPFRVDCDIHAWMSSYWLVLDHPFAAVTNAQGRFAIDDIPPGEYEFRMWHEAAGWLEKAVPVVIIAGKTTQLDALTYDLKTFEETP